MGKLRKVPKKNENLQDYRKRLVESQNNNPLVRIGLLKRIKQFFSLKDVVSSFCGVLYAKRYKIIVLTNIIRKKI